LLTIRGVGTVGVTSGFEGIVSDQFDTDTTVAGTITLVNISVMRSGTDGAWETAAGSNTSMSFTDLGSGGGNTLQQAYDADPDGGDALITTNATDGSVVIAGTESLRITASGGLDVDTVADFDAPQFEVDVTGAGFSLDADTASNVTATGANLSLQTLTSGVLLLAAAGLLDIDAAAAMDVDVTGAYTLDATSSVSIDAAESSNISMTANDAGAQTLTLDATNAGAGAGHLDVNVDNDFTLDAGTMSLDATGNSNVTVTGGELALQTVTSGEIDLTSAGLMDLNAGANLDIDVTGTVTLDATGTMSLDAVGNSNMTVDSGDLDLVTTTSGGVNITSVDPSTYTVPNGQAAA
ncbi:MAG: hypothetical protein MJA83_20450, partial [Gammaproteobacteria bacterium]|nr:hypothetical protein [Gammaproteobacteria bacterium]